MEIFMSRAVFPSAACSTSFVGSFEIRCFLCPLCVQKLDRRLSSLSITKWLNFCRCCDGQFVWERVLNHFLFNQSKVRRRKAKKTEYSHTTPCTRVSAKKTFFAQIEFWLFVTHFVCLQLFMSDQRGEKMINLVFYFRQLCVCVCCAHLVRTFVFWLSNPTKMDFLGSQPESTERKFIDLKVSFYQRNVELIKLCFNINKKFSSHEFHFCVNWFHFPRFFRFRGLSASATVRMMTKVCNHILWAGTRTDWANERKRPGLFCV